MKTEAEYRASIDIDIGENDIWVGLIHSIKGTGFPVRSEIRFNAKSKISQEDAIRKIKDVVNRINEVLDNDKEK